MAILFKYYYAPEAAEICERLLIILVFGIAGIVVLNILSSNILAIVDFISMCRREQQETHAQDRANSENMNNY